VKRWLSLLELADVVAKSNPRVDRMTRKRKREHVLRKVRRVEELNGERISKKVRGEWFVSSRAADELQKWDPDSLHELGRSVADLHRKRDEDRKRLNGHGAKLREHDQRLGIVEEKQKIAEVYLNAMAAIDRRNSAA
jgi:hypothetical protein